MATQDGGPAFPCEQHQDADGSWNQTFDPGMSLRDWFAGMAMQAIYGGLGAQQVAARDRRYDETNWGDVVASNAYEMADAMIKAREGE